MSNHYLWVPVDRYLNGNAHDKYRKLSFRVVPFCGVFFSHLGSDDYSSPNSAAPIHNLSILKNNDKHNWLCGGDIDIKSVVKSEPFRYFAESGNEDDALLLHPFLLTLASLSSQDEQQNTLVLQLAAESESDCDAWIASLQELQLQLCFRRICAEHALQPSQDLFFALQRSLREDKFEMCDFSINENQQASKVLQTSLHFFQASMSLGRIFVFHSLTLSNCELSDVNTPLLAQCIASVPYIQHLDLSMNALSSQGMKTLCDELIKCRYLQFISLAQNNISDLHFEHFANVLYFLAHTVSSLTELNLSQNRLSERAAIVLGKKFSKFSKRSSLKKIDLSLNPLGDAIVPFIEVLLLDSSSTISEINVSNCGLSEWALLQLCRAISKCSSLTSISFGGNPVLVPGSRVMISLIQAVCAHHHKFRDSDGERNSLSKHGLVLQLGGQGAIDVFSSHEESLSLTRTLKLALAELSDASSIFGSRFFRRNSDGRSHSFGSFHLFSSPYFNESNFPYWLACALSITDPFQFSPIAWNRKTVSQRNEHRVDSLLISVQFSDSNFSCLRPSEQKRTPLRLSSRDEFPSASQLCEKLIRHCASSPLWLQRLGVLSVCLEQSADRNGSGSDEGTQEVKTGNNESSSNFKTQPPQLRKVEDMFIPIYCSLGKDSSSSNGRKVFDEELERALQAAQRDIANEDALNDQKEIDDLEDSDQVVNLKKSSVMVEDFETWMEKENKRREEKRVNERLVLAVRRLYSLGEVSSRAAKFWEGVFGNKKYRSFAETELLLSMRHGSLSPSAEASDTGSVGSHAAFSPTLTTQYIFPSITKREFVYEAMFSRDVDLLRSLLSSSFNRSQATNRHAFSVNSTTGGQAYVFAQRLLAELSNLQQNFINLQRLCRSYQELPLVEDYLLQCAKCAYTGPEMFAAINLRQEILQSACLPGSKFRAAVQNDFSLIQHKAMLSNLLVSRDWDNLRSKVDEVSLFLQNMPCSATSAGAVVFTDLSSATLDVSVASSYNASSSMEELNVAKMLLTEHARVRELLQQGISLPQIDSLDYVLSLASFHAIFMPEVEMAVKAFENSARNPAKLLKPILKGLRENDIHQVEKGFEECMKMGLQHEALDAVVCSKIHVFKNKIVQDDSVRDKLIKTCLAIKNGFIVPPGEIMMLLRQAHKIKLNDDPGMKPYFHALGKHTRKFVGLQKQEQLIQKMIVDQDIFRLSKVLSGRGNGKLLMSFPTAFARDQWAEKLLDVCAGKYAPKEPEERESPQQYTRRNAQTGVQLKKEIAEEQDVVVFQGSFEKAARSEENGIRGWRKRFFILRSSHLTYYTKPQGEKKGTIRVLNGAVRKIDLSNVNAANTHDHLFSMNQKVDLEIKTKFPAKLYCLELEEGRDLSLISKDLLDEARRLVRLAKIQEIERLLKHGLQIKSRVLLSKLLSFAKQLEIMLDYGLMSDAKSCLQILESQSILRRLYYASFRCIPKLHTIQALLQAAKSCNDVHPQLPSVVQLQNILSVSTKSPARQELLRLRSALLNAQHTAFLFSLKVLCKMDIGSLSIADQTEFIRLFLQFVAEKALKILRENISTVVSINRILKLALSLITNYHIEVEIMDLFRLLIEHTGYFTTFSQLLAGSLAFDESEYLSFSPAISPSSSPSASPGRRPPPSFAAKHSQAEIVTDLIRFCQDLSESSAYAFASSTMPGEMAISQFALSKYPLLVSSLAVTVQASSSLFMRSPMRSFSRQNANTATVEQSEHNQIITQLSTNSNENVLSFSRDILTKALLQLPPEISMSFASPSKGANDPSVGSLSPQEYQALAIETYLAIQCIMGDRDLSAINNKAFLKKSRLFPSHSSHKAQSVLSRDDCVRALIDIGSDQEHHLESDNHSISVSIAPLSPSIIQAIRDEMFMQLSKQLSLSNPSLSSLLVGWKLFALLLLAHPPSSSLLPFLMHNAEEHREHFKSLSSTAARRASVSLSVSARRSSASIDAGMPHESVVQQKTKASCLYKHLSFLCEYVRNLCQRIEEQSSNLESSKNKNSPKSTILFPLARILSSASLSVSPSMEIPTNLYWDILCEVVFDDVPIDARIVFLCGDVASLSLFFGEASSPHTLLSLALHQILPTQLGGYFLERKEMLAKEKDGGSSLVLFNEYDSFLKREGERPRATEGEREEEREAVDIDSARLQEKETERETAVRVLLSTLEDFSLFQCDKASLCEGTVKIDLHRLAVQPPLMQMIPRDATLQWILLDSFIRERTIQMHTQSEEDDSYDERERRERDREVLETLSLQRTLMFRRETLSLREKWLWDDFSLLGREFVPRDSVSRGETWIRWISRDREVGRLTERAKRDDETQGHEEERKESVDAKLNEEVSGAAGEGAQAEGKEGTASPTAKNEEEEELLPEDSLYLDLVFAEETRFVNARLAALREEHFLILIALQLALSWHSSDSAAVSTEIDDGRDVDLEKERQAERRRWLANDNPSCRSPFDLTLTLAESSEQRERERSTGVEVIRNSILQRALSRISREREKQKEKDLEVVRPGISFAPPPHLKKASHGEREENDDDSDSSTSEVGTRRVRRYVDSDSDEESHADENDDAESELSSIISELDVDVDAEREEREREMRARERPPLVTLQQAMASREEDRMHHLLVALGFPDTREVRRVDHDNQSDMDASSVSLSLDESLEASAQSSSLHDPPALRRLWNLVAQFHRLPVEHDWDIVSNLRYRYFLKRAFHSFLVAVCPFYGHHLSPIHWTQVTIKSDRGQTYRSAESLGISASEEAVIKDASHRLQESALPVLASVSLYGFYLLWPQDWSVVFHAPFWDIAELSISSERQVDTLHLSVNALQLSLRGVHVKELLSALLAHSLRSAARGLSPHGALSFSVPVNTPLKREGETATSAEWFHSLCAPPSLALCLEEFAPLAQVFSFTLSPQDSKTSSASLALRACKAMVIRAPPSRRELVARQRREEDLYEAELSRFAENSLATKNECEITIARETLRQRRDKSEAEEEEDADGKDHANTDENGDKRQSVRRRAYSQARFGGASAQLSPAEQLLFSLCGVHSSSSNVPSLLEEFPIRCQGRVRENSRIVGSDQKTVPATDVSRLPRMNRDFVRSMPSPEEKRKEREVESQCAVAQSLTEQWRQSISRPRPHSTERFREVSSLPYTQDEDAEEGPLLMGLDHWVRRRRKQTSEV